MSFALSPQHGEYNEISLKTISSTPQSQILQRAAVPVSQCVYYTTQAAVNYNNNEHSRSRIRGGSSYLKTKTRLGLELEPAVVQQSNTVFLNRSVPGFSLDSPGGEAVQSLHESLNSSTRDSCKWSCDRETLAEFVDSYKALLGPLLCILQPYTVL
ncbi:uncharacterized protein V6R79_016491 [Siganus canaliculatus]